ncbi:hypothetical protein GCM10027605_02010 [Micromonospora zhanjiangensis]
MVDGCWASTRVPFRVEKKRYSGGFRQINPPSTLPAECSSRMEAFSDGVFTIAATLLFLALAIYLVVPLADIRRALFPRS